MSDQDDTRTPHCPFCFARLDDVVPVAALDALRAERDAALERDANLHRRVQAKLAALDAGNYSSLELIADLERLATHPVWEASNRAAADVEAACAERDAALAKLKDTEAERDRLIARLHQIDHPRGPLDNCGMCREERARCQS